MTITTTTHQEAITTAIEQAIDRLPKGIKAMQQGTWLELALATHGGHCPDDPTQQTKPAWDWVDGGIIRGSWGDGQCGGCGQLGRGWIETGARDLSTVSVDTSETDDADYLMAEAVERALTAMRMDLDTAWDRTTSDLAEHVRAGLLRELSDALAEMAVDDGLDDEDVTTGSDLTPGIYRDGYGEWLAWDYDPRDRDRSDTIAVYESDLDG